MEGPAKLGIGVAVASILIFGGIILIDRQKNPDCGPLGEQFPEQGREHIAVGSPHPDYNSNPPTSGPHYGEPAAWGKYDSPLPDEQLVHNLEHGGVNVFYKPDAIDPSIVEQLREIQREFPNKSVLTPRPQNEHLISVASWTYLKHFDSFDPAAIREFARCNKNKAPEFFPD